MQNTKAPAQHAKDISLPPIGAYIANQGGIFAGIFQPDGGQPYFLIVAENDSGNAEWGRYGLREPDAISSHDGAANTQALLASEHDHPAAKLAASYTADGLHDFYLPSRRELALCSANIPRFFDPAYYYWSSTQYSPNHAFVQDFGDGCQDFSGKGNERRVRAVRRVLVI